MVSCRFGFNGKQVSRKLENRAAGGKPPMNPGTSGAASAAAAATAAGVAAALGNADPSRGRYDFQIKQTCEVLI